MVTTHGGATGTIEAVQPGVTGREAGLARGLVIGHDAEYAQFVCDSLAGRVDVRMTTSTEMALGLLVSREYEVVVLEHTAAGALPLRALLRHIRSHQRDAGVLVMSQDGLMAREIVECFEADADDYVVAPFHPAELAARIARMVRRVERARMTAPARAARTPRPRTAVADALGGDESIVHPQHGAERAA
ncbi:MAG: hypothetical protein M0R75_09100 [Dehalococcoidia bacterium]|nr:hypothetical protein [Dehalococcoidia bacterium]